MNVACMIIILLCLTYNYDNNTFAGRRYVLLLSVSLLLAI